MAPTIHLIRHAQGYHNLATSNHGMHDPRLTPYGEEQCKLLSETFTYAQEIDMIVASPLRRTIQTARLSFPNTLIPIIALPEVQETSNLPCDTGTEKEILETEFRNYNVDFSLVTEGWNSKRDRWSPRTFAIRERCRIARKWLSKQTAKHIVVVTHGGLLHHLTQDWEDFQKFPGTGWANTEYRTYTVDPNSGSEFSLVETKDSRVGRFGAKKPPCEVKTHNTENVLQKEKGGGEYERERVLTSKPGGKQSLRKDKPQKEEIEADQEPLRMIAKV